MRKNPVPRDERQDNRARSGELGTCCRCTDRKRMRIYGSAPSADTEPAGMNLWDVVDCNPSRRALLGQSGSSRFTASRHTPWATLSTLTSFERITGGLVPFRVPEPGVPGGRHRLIATVTSVCAGQ